MDADKTCIGIIEATFNEGGMDTPEYEEYAKRSNANGEAHGGVVLSKYMIDQNLGNGDSPHVVLILEYPSREKAVQAFTSEEYNSIKPLRDVALKEVNILITKS